MQVNWLSRVYWHMGFINIRHVCVKNAYKHFNCINVCHQLVCLRNLLFIIKIYLYVMCMDVLPPSTSAPHMCHAHRVQKRALAPLELKSLLWVTMWVLEIKPRLYGRTAIALNHTAICLAQGTCFKIVFQCVITVYNHGAKTASKRELCTCPSLQGWVFWKLSTSFWCLFSVLLKI